MNISTFNIECHAEKGIKNKIHMYWFHWDLFMALWQASVTRMIITSCFQHPKIYRPSAGFDFHLPAIYWSCATICMSGTLEHVDQLVE